MGRRLGLGARELELCEVDVGALVRAEVRVEASYDLVVVGWPGAQIGSLVLLLKSLLVEALFRADPDGGTLL